MLGPAEALILSFKISDNDIVQGQLTNFEIKIQIENKEIIDIEHITLSLSGPRQLTCRFYPNGTLLDACPEIQIKQIEKTNYTSRTYNYNYGYGYGYSYQGYTQGLLKYNITFSSENLPPGEYQVKYIVSTARTKQESSQKSMIIRPPESVQGCSIRAIGGTATLGDESFKKRNRLNLYVPAGKATDGRGAFTAQNGERLSYSYNIRGASQIGPDIIRFFVAGEVRDKGNRYYEPATITLNKATSTVSINGQTFEVKEMQISFMNC